MNETEMTQKLNPDFIKHLPLALRNLITDLSLQPKSGGQKILLWGRSGTGKTYSLRTIPKDQFPVAIIDIDRGCSAIAQSLQGQALSFTPSLATHNPTSTTAPKTYDQIMEWIAPTYKHIAPKTWVIDSLTGLYREIHNECRFHAKRPAKRKSEWDEYGASLIMFTTIITRLIGTGNNLICTAHVRSVKEKDKKKDGEEIAEYVPSMTGQLAYNMPSLFDEVYYVDASPNNTDFRGTWQVKPSVRVYKTCRTRIFHDKDTKKIPQDFSQIFERKAKQ